jgi:hypothetical protein
MRAVQGAIVTTVREHRVFPGQNLQAARYPSVKDVRSLPRLLHLSLASPWVHIPWGLSWLSFSAAPRLTESPPASPGGLTSRLASTSPRQQRCANSVPQARTPRTGLRRDKHRSYCSRTLVTASPALNRHGLPSKVTLRKVFPSRPDSRPSRYRIESRDYSFAVPLPDNGSGHGLPELQSQARANGLLREASVALQGLLMGLADSSLMRDGHALVLQHEPPPSALGQA